MVGKARHRQPQQVHEGRSIDRSGGRGAVIVRRSGRDRPAKLSVERSHGTSRYMSHHHVHIRKKTILITKNKKVIETRHNRKRTQSTQVSPKVEELTVVDSCDLIVDDDDDLQP
jgi:hypothetical protein